MREREIDRERERERKRWRGRERKRIERQSEKVKSIERVRLNFYYLKKGRIVVFGNRAPKQFDRLTYCTDLLTDYITNR